ncbi:hypothetical protein M9980_07015 [Sphingomonas donggukensis]|uniref:DUF5666 domain-containing protein n=1 Tax=Sphingomonas donggukensis TaxID=2949093 RepID=A0ABY4TX09_9SPHN|nr:hypothetical protein [Sphingomonas donggukensis]URW76937.1 hypothetical protein M9980_07015 [Sphingomonas donggukensis]
MRTYLIALACASALAPAAVCAQTAPAPAPVPATATIAASTETMLRAGTPIALKTAEPLTTEGKKLRIGQRVQLEVAEPVMIGSTVVIPAGSPATGEITDVRNKGMWGKSGRINARVLFARVNGRQIRLTGGFDDKGKAGGVGAAAVSAIVFLPAGFFMTGTSAKIPLGAPVGAFLDEDLPVTFAAAAPLAAPAATPVVTAAPAAAVPVSTTTTIKK